MALPGLAEAQAAHGTAAYNVGELKLAANAYGRAVALEPENLAYLSNYALFLGYDDRLEEGLAVLLKLVERPDGQDARTFINLGWIYRHFRPARVSDAVAAYEKALKIEPKNAKAALGVALSYRAGAQWTRAVTAYERVVQVNPRLEGEALLGTAWCHFRAGDDYKARFYAGLAAKAGVDVGPLRNALLGPPKVGAAIAQDGGRAQRARPPARREERPASRRSPRNACWAWGAPPSPRWPKRSATRERPSPCARPSSEASGRSGPAARDALPTLDRAIKAGPPASSSQKAREAKLVAEMQTAATKIRGEVTTRRSPSEDSGGDSFQNG